MSLLYYVSLGIVLLTPSSFTVSAILEVRRHAVDVEIDSSMYHMSKSSKTMRPN